MRVLICGSRTWTDARTIEQMVGSLPPGSTVIHGGAQGADLIAHFYATHYRHTVEAYHANWREHGRAAGPMRNQQMLDQGKPDEVWAFQLNKSRGTQDMIDRAKAAGVPVVEFA